MLNIIENNFLNFILLAFLFVIGVILFVYVISVLLKFVPVLKETGIWISKYIYLILIPIPLGYLIYYNAYYDANHPETSIFGSTENIEYVRDISIYFFTAGIFSATLKFLNTFVYFQQSFERIIMSEKFDKMLTDKLELLTFSHEHLSKLNNLHDNWKSMTLCKYEQKFPELMNKLRKNLENELFKENNLTCYYKNFRIQVNIELLEGSIIKITELTSCTLIPKSEDKIPVEFWMSVSEDDNDKTYSKFIPEETKINGAKFDEYVNDENLLKKEVVKDGIKTTHFTFYLQDKSEYHLERRIEMTQDLNIDRLYGFDSSKIIDDISVHVQYCDKLRVFFSSIGKNKFYKDNLILDGEAYINRDVLLPGEIFNVFIYKSQ
jgi:hypothetical protein